ncbi:N-acetyltransferase ESCO1 [Clarias magur]|uniref:N-acetyltransferase ESCO1 n=1 Tax=Clarias magur TaxID=1594786 RepID=A0A8J4T2Q6_CLAMG|nr:N-acetyltransferase ESCO1 [Clarias magur]
MLTALVRARLKVEFAFLKMTNRLPEFDQMWAHGDVLCSRDTVGLLKTLFVRENSVLGDG